MSHCEKGVRAHFWRTADDDPRLQRRRRVVELQRHEALPGALLETLEDALVAGIAGDRQAELGAGLEHLAELFHRQHAAVVGKRVDHHGGVIARLEDLVEVNDARHLAHGGTGR